MTRDRSTDSMAAPPAGFPAPTSRPGLVLALSVILTVPLVLTGLTATRALSQQPVLAGIDLLETNEEFSFYDLSDVVICPDCIVVSDPVIPLFGVPRGDDPVCGSDDLGPTDSIVQRPEDTPVLFPGDEAQVPIEIVDLHLRSAQPFTVVCEGETQQWMLDVTVDPEQQQPGQMQIRKTHENGGTFNGQLPVKPIFVFTRVDDDPPLLICELEPPPVIFQIEGPWVHQSNDFPLLEIPGCTSNFIPGIDGENEEQAFGVLLEVPTQDKQIHWFPATSETSSNPTHEAVAQSELMLPATPNPFTESTALRYQLSEPGPVRLEIYNVGGRAVRTLVNAVQPIGTHQVDWDGRDQTGRRVSSGVYTYAIRTSGGLETRTFTLLR